MSNERSTERSPERKPPLMEWKECRHCGTPLPSSTPSTPLNHITLQGFCSHECKVIFHMSR